MCRPQHTKVAGIDWRANPESSAWQVPVGVYKLETKIHIASTDSAVLEIKTQLFTRTSSTTSLSGFHTNFVLTLVVRWTFQDRRPCRNKTFVQITRQKITTVLPNPTSILANSINVMQSFGLLSTSRSAGLTPHVPATAPSTSRWASRSWSSWKSWNRLYWKNKTIHKTLGQNNN